MLVLNLSFKYFDVQVASDNGVLSYNQKIATSHRRLFEFSKCEICSDHTMVLK